MVVVVVVVVVVFVVWSAVCVTSGHVGILIILNNVLIDVVTCWENICNYLKGLEYAQNLYKNTVQESCFPIQLDFNIIQKTLDTITHLIYTQPVVSF